MAHVDANGLRFHVQLLRHAGSGARTSDGAGSGPRPAVVMVHGLVVDNLSSYYYTLAHPVALVADTYLYDLRGHGRSEVPSTGYGVDEHVADLAALLDVWEVGRPVHLVGTSFGGSVALALARRQPERVASLVLIEAHVPCEGWGEHMAGSLAGSAFGLDEAGIREWLAHHATRRLGRMARHAEQLLLHTSLIDELQREPPIPAAALASVRCPTLAFYGEQSDILEHGRALARHVPRCELHVVPECGHPVLYEATALVRQRTLEWLARHGGDAAGVPGMLDVRQADPMGA